MNIADAAHVVVTDFGVVRLSPKVLGYLSGLDSNWYEIARNKRKRGKRAQFIRRQLEAVEQAVSLLAHIEYVAGGDLEKV